LFGLGPACLAEGGAEGFGIGHDGVARKVQRLTGALRRVGFSFAESGPSLWLCSSMISGQTLRVCPEGKPVSTPGVKPEGMLFGIVL